MIFEEKYSFKVSKYLEEKNILYNLKDSCLKSDSNAQSLQLD